MARVVATTPAVKRTPWYETYELPTLVPGALLAGLMLWSISRSLIESNWASGMELLTGLTLLALVVGVVFARLSWMPGWLAHLLAMLLGITLTVNQVAPILTERVKEQFGSDLAGRLNSWPEQATELALRAVVWLRILQAGGRGEDIVLFVLTVALLMWLLGYATGWLIFREARTWLTIAVGAMIILINYTFTWPKPTLLFFVFLGSALVLMVYSHVVQQQRLWRAARIEIPGLLLFRAIIAATAFCAAVVLITSVIPGTVTSSEAQRAWRVIRAPFASLRESWQDAFSTINAPPNTSGSFATRGVRVGGPRSLSDAVVMRVRAPKYDYWRAVAFDKYNGLNWQNTVGERARAALNVPTAEQARTFVEPGEPLLQAELRSRELVTQTITLVQTRPDGLLMVGGQFGSASVPVLIQHGVLTEESGETLPNYTETASVVAEVPLDETSVYTISTYLSNVDERSLRQAGNGYPEWVTAAYLQLPPSLPVRVAERARMIVTQANATNPYDQALAIQDALRQLRYDERRPAPPEDRDWVDYFVFDSQTGYCDDFATAMVIMLRTLDIPARWVQGYAGGKLDQQTGEWIVSESVAHSWVEAYFPGYGWQRFEPTPAPYAIVPARPAVPISEDDQRPESSGDVSNALSDPEEIMRRIRQREEELAGGDGDGSALARLIAERDAAARAQLYATIGLSLAGLFGILLAGLAVLRFQLRGLSPVAATYARMTRLAGWAGIPHEEYATPREYAELVSQHAPTQRDAIREIAAAYESERYRPDHNAANQIEGSWAGVRNALIGRLFARIFTPRKS